MDHVHTRVDPICSRCDFMRPLGAKAWHARRVITAVSVLSEGIWAALWAC